MRIFMKKYCLLLLLPILVGCGNYNAIYKTSDYDFKYEAAKAYYIDGNYKKASELFSSMLVALKGTPSGGECMYLLAMSNFMYKDYETAATFFKKYYQSYPKGPYVEIARFNCAYSLYKQIPDVRLDQSVTRDAILEFTNFLELFPSTSLKDQTNQMVETLNDALAEKEYLSAKMYFDLGDYMMNCSYGGNNYEACIITAQNGLKDFPYVSSSRREELSILILRARHKLARQSVEDKRLQRYRETIDEYYAFCNDFPESKYMAEAKAVFDECEHTVSKKNWNLDSDDEDEVKTQSQTDLASPSKKNKKK